MKVKAIGALLLLVVAVVLALTTGTHAAPNAKATGVVTSQPAATTANEPERHPKFRKPSHLCAMRKNTWNTPPMILEATAWKRFAPPTKPYSNWKFA
jgi:hypothetical protein